MQLLFPRQVGCAAATRLLFVPGQAAHGIGPLRIRPVIPELRIASPPSSRWYAVDLRALDEKWRHTWQSAKPAHATRGEENQDVRRRKPTMVLPMFPYPSGSLHLGHLRVYTIADVVARYHKLRGFDVMLPIGWDAFGLPAENAALERGIRPADWTRTNIAKMKDQLQRMNASYNWDRELTTCDPSFYKHTQKLFLMLFECGLAYQAEAEVNYDPVDKTVLANEQVDARDRSWRSGALVEKKMMKQWFFRISDFRETLLQGLDDLARDSAWPASVLTQQRHWLGKSAGACIKFPVLSFGTDVGAAIEVFTTRPDTLFGVQYLALSAAHPAVARLAESDPELQAFLSTLPALPPDSKVGYLLPQLRAINPLAYHDETPDASKESVPIYVAPYVLDDYGEGAVMGVPGHDVRDHSFWQTHQKHQPIRIVLAASEDESTTAMVNAPFVDHGIMTDHSGMFKGKSSVEAGELLLKMLEAADMARRTERWHLHDWLVSRQRYWGTPIPIVHCGSCGAVPVPDEQLPVVLPPVDEHWAEAKTGNALETAADFLEMTCPRCGGSAQRETDTMDTFVDSSWYYARFADPHNVKHLVAPDSGRLLPVDIYLGGKEHAIMHLLYARFIYKFLASTSLLPQYPDATAPSAEPFRRLITQGMVHGKTYSDPETGRFLRERELDLSNASSPKIASTGKEAVVTFEKMSKSKHNGVDPGDCIAKHGADATRAHMLFQAPVGDVVNWDEAKIAGITRWMRRLHELVNAAAAASPSSATPQTTVIGYLEIQYKKLPRLRTGETKQWDADVRLWREVQRTIASVRKSLDEIYSLNTVVSDLMSLTNLLGSSEEASGLVKRQAASTVVLLLAPITPAFAEECWSILQPLAGSIFETASFPETDGSLNTAMLQPRQQACAVQVNGKTREVLKLPPPPAELEGDGLREWMVTAILQDAQGRERFGAGKYDVSKARRTIPVKGGKVINFVM